MYLLIALLIAILHCFVIILGFIWIKLVYTKYMLNVCEIGTCVFITNICRNIRNVGLKNTQIIQTLPYNNKDVYFWT